MKTLRLETTAPFQGLAELVADAEGLFAAEGLRIEWVKRAKVSCKFPCCCTSVAGYRLNSRRF